MLLLAPCVKIIGLVSIVIDFEIRVPIFPVDMKAMTHNIISRNRRFGQMALATQWEKTSHTESLHFQGPLLQNSGSLPSTLFSCGLLMFLDVLPFGEQECRHIIII